MRNYIEATWNDADQYNYSGEQIGNRGRKSGRVHFNPDGSACVASYDEPKTTKISIKDKILPQFKRLQTLRTQMVDLEQEYKTTEMTCAEYSMLRDVIVCKIARTEVLYRKAISVRPVSYEDDIDLYTGLPEDEVVYEVTNHVNPQSESDIGCQWIDELSSENSLKKPLKIACTLIRTAVRWHQAARNYIKTLSEV